MATAAAEYVYETLDPLYFSGEPDLAPAGETFEVFRTQITSSATDPSDVPAVDYFPLDASSTADEVPLRGAAATTPPSPSYTPGPSRASELAWFCGGRRFKSPMLQLHKEILDFCNFVLPTPEEQASRDAAVQSVFEVIKYIWPHCKVEVFGSFRTGLYLPTSDIDAVILESRVKTPQMGLRALARALSQRSIARKMQVIAKARVPIVKFVEKRSGIAFDVSFDVESGPKAAEFIKNAVNKIPPLRPLCLILKVFLQQRELNEVYTGGIGSYALLTMLIAHLQMHWSERDFQGRHQSTEHNLGILLVNFFDLYGRKLNNWDVGVSCKLAGSFFLKSDKGFMNSERPYLLSIEDPQAPDNDIGKNSHKYLKVKSAFSMAYSLLTDAKAIMDLGPDRSILGSIIRPDPVLLDRRHGQDGERTFNSLLPGAGEHVLQQFGSEGDSLYNWQLVDDEPLPRERIVTEDYSLTSPWKRKASKVKHRSRKGDNMESSSRREENVYRRESGVKKKQRKRYQDEDQSSSKVEYLESSSRCKESGYSRESGVKKKQRKGYRGEDQSGRSNLPHYSSRSH